ncbi:trypsin-7-like [Ischnura elegans]|uniref:trypsin-7-like n=1 Tax=Ischnura elegans TaxID=197161 RepID=UPI001ED8B075|nr:trypsin-7-like [Ischnura elegans]XP_046404257.1 trypsin-7-like [Ischnura elegans]
MSNSCGILITAVALLSSFTDPAIGHPRNHDVGNNTHINAFNYQLSLYEEDIFICGAAMLSDEWAITTAHCTQVKNRKELNLRLGISIGEGEAYPVVTVITHPLFDDHSLDFDYALLQVKKPFIHPKNQKLNHVSLASRMVDSTWAYVSGWGTTKDGEEIPAKHLRHANVTVYPHESCKGQHNGIKKRMICASDPIHPKRSCVGDTGGPLVHKGKLIGMVSWGQHCQNSDDTVVYAAIAPIHKWIRKHLNI